MQHTWKVVMCYEQGCDGALQRGSAPNGGMPATAANPHGSLERPAYSY